MVKFSDQEAKEIEQALILTRVDVGKLKQALAEKDAELSRWKARSWDENVRFIADSKEQLLKEYIHLTELYGEQKHEIRKLKSNLAEKDLAYQQLMEKAVLFATWLKQAMDNEADEAQDADAFLKSTEVQAWKECKT